MFAWTGRAAAPAVQGAPSPLLTHLAGEFAPRVAGLWPEPHAVFVTAPAARRHLLCLALSRTGGDPPMVPAEAILHAPMRRAIRQAVPEAPNGLERALSRLGEVAWPAQGYAALLRVLGHQRASKGLRHADHISKAHVATLAALPDTLLAAGLGAHAVTPAQATLLAEAHAALARRDGADLADAAAARWARTRTYAEVVDLVILDLAPEPAPPPFVGGARLRPLASKAAIVDAAGRYRNCLRHRLHDAATGVCAIYEWLGDPPAVIEIVRDPLVGWQVAEVRRVDNDPIPEADQPAMLAELGAMGVHVGRPSWNLTHALHLAVEPEFILAAPEAAARFVF